MRAQAVEKMLSVLTDEMEKIWRTEFSEDVDWNRFKNLTAKAKILLDRNDPRDASVIRELMNGKLDA